MSTPASRIRRRRFWASRFALHLSRTAEWALALTLTAVVLLLGSVQW